jgi:hypothetical protein
VTGTETVFTIVAAVAVASVAVLIASFIDLPHLHSPLPALFALLGTAVVSVAAFDWAGHLGRRVHHNRHRSTKGDTHHA